HPVTTEVERLQHDINEIIAALRASQRRFLVIYPNNDRGSELILEALRQLAGEPNFVLRSSFRFEYYLTLLKHADVLVGNSSAGIHEAPVYGVPTINIGSRQRNRFHHQSIRDVEPVREDIIAALRDLPGRFPPCLQFGRGNSAELFIRCLAGDAVWRISPQKQFRDLPE
ncbi:MAG: UDP-N-acetylglucosamine 2-epimerase, partial [Victivallales bacterium]|nr:UDP-N-acetylglucosamine 2-epimerase [Victivallales bacterium]